MSGSISNFFNDLGNDLEDAVNRAATEVRDAADDVRNDTGGGNAATTQPAPVQPSSPTPIPEPPASPQLPSPTEPPGSDTPLVRLYEAAFARGPDSGGLAFWENALQTGVGLPAVADAFVASPEFQQRYGALDTQQFVDRLYLNVLGREADPAGEAFWTNVIDNGGADRGDVLLAFSQVPEFASRAGTVPDAPLV